MSIDVNEEFTRTRADLEAGLGRSQGALRQQVADGTLRSLGGGRFQFASGGDRGEIVRIKTNELGEIELVANHGLDTSTGEAALYTRTPAWHALGNVVPEGVSSIEEVLKLGGINWRVAKRPAAFIRPDGVASEIDGSFFTVREDLEVALGTGVVRDRYEIFQNDEGFRFLEDLTGEYGVVWDSAGALAGGAKTFVSMRLPENLVVDPEGIADEVVPYLACINDHTGSGSMGCLVSPWRIKCANTERFAHRDARSSWATRHTTNMRHRLVEARTTLGLTVAYLDTWLDEANVLARADAAIREFEAVRDALWTPPDEESGKHARTRWNNRAEILDGLWLKNSTELGRTAYAVERAYTEYFDHETVVPQSMGLRGGNLAVRATRVLEGTHDEAKSRVHRQLLTLVRR